VKTTESSHEPDHNLRLPVPNQKQARQTDVFCRCKSPYRLARFSTRPTPSRIVELSRVALLSSPGAISNFYKQTALGATWVIIQPLSQCFCYVDLWQARHACLPKRSLSLFAYAGLVSVGRSSLTPSQTKRTESCGSSNLISKVYFPRIFIPAAQWERDSGFCDRSSIASPNVVLLQNKSDLAGSPSCHFLQH
jgi:hypothetical protein